MTARRWIILVYLIGVLAAGVIFVPWRTTIRGYTGIRSFAGDRPAVIRPIFLPPSEEHPDTKDNSTTVVTSVAARPLVDRVALEIVVWTLISLALDAFIRSGRVSEDGNAEPAAPSDVE